MSVLVTNIAPEVDEAQISAFFSFCGTISKITLDKDGELQKARIAFEKDEAAKTALLLSGTQLGSLKVDVSADSAEPASAAATDTAGEGDDISQEDKPKSAIIAEILSHGFVLSDHAVDKAAEFDKKHGISARFTQFLTGVDSKYNISNRAASTASTADSKFNISAHAQVANGVFHKYFEKALDTTAGAKVRQFYASAAKNAADIHAEARRLADIREAEAKPGAGTTGTAEAAELAPEKAAVSL